MSFADLKLGPKILRALADLSYESPTPIQAQAIPVVAAGEDVVACAQTGTGKTAAFSLPLIERIAQRKEKWRRTTVLVLAPTRELAIQIADNVEKYTAYLPIRSLAVFGGVNFDRQVRAWEKGVQILVATPGRLVDHLGQGTIDLSEVETLVLDEADNMLDMGFIHDVRKIIARLPRKRQNLLFSATFPAEVKEFVEEIASNPKKISVAPDKPAIETVEQVVHRVDRSRRRALLSHLITSGDWEQVLVFTRTKHGANRLAEQLRTDGIVASAIHGNKSQSARERALAEFKSGEGRALVATDIAARGIDISELPHVVNFDLPDVPEVYVHRIGRTGRAGRSGHAVSLVCVDDLERLAAIEKLLRKSIPQEVIPGFEHDPHAKPAPKPERRGRPGPRGMQDGGQPARGSRRPASRNRSGSRRR